MKMNTKKILALVLMVSAIGLYGLGIAILPSEIGVQIQLDGSIGNTINKYLGLILPLGLTLIFAFLYYREQQGKHLLLAGVGLLLYGLTFFMNL
jgi:hypothetical protein